VIAVIGAGGYLFPLALIRDILSFEALQHSSIRLYDIDHERSQATADGAARLVRKHKLEADISVVEDRATALQGAEFVICTFQVGGMGAFRHDVEIPRKFGVDQPVGDTLGPGGIFRGLRTIHALRELAIDMRRHCPGALLIQYANPMSPNCWATSRLGTETIGFCHSVQQTSRMLAEELGVPYEDVTFDVAGVNHTAWFTTFRRGDEDLVPAIRRTMIERHVGESPTGGQGPSADSYLGKNERVRTELMRLTGYFHTESSHHASEYWPWFRKTPDAVSSMIETRWDYYENSLARSPGQWIENIVGAPLEPSDEYGAYLIDSVVSDTRRIVYGNVPNGGLIANLPEDACVEVACAVDRNGVRPLRYGALPPACAALNQVQVNVQRLIVEAALTGNRSLVHAAVALDPLTGAILTLPEIRRMTNRMFEAEAEWLPQFRDARA
jgi:alpha-galactosidase